MNQAFLKKFILAAVLATSLSACGGGGSSSPEAPIRQPDGGPVPQNYDVKISSADCMDPFPFVSNYQGHGGYLR